MLIVKWKLSVCTKNDKYYEFSARSEKLTLCLPLIVMFQNELFNL